MIIKFKNSILFAINSLVNLLYQKLKYNKDYLFVSNQRDIEIHKNNYYLKKIQDRKKKVLQNTVLVDLNKLSFDNSININDPLNPLVSTVSEISLNPDIKLEETSIYKFFNKFEPKNLSEVFFIDNKEHNIKNSKLLRLNQYTMFYPWFHKYPKKFLVPGMFGPKDVSFPLSRFIRLKNLIYLISTYGYKPDENDQIAGYVLKQEGDYRFVITAGAHRASVLKSLYSENYNQIQVKYDNFRVNKNFFTINLKDIKLWPGVKSGYISKTEAEKFFLSFFKFKIL